MKKDYQNPTNLAEAELGDTVYFKSYEGIKENGAGQIIDLWYTWNSTKEWYATLQYYNKKVCVLDSDIRFIVR